jgi:hypothetical protein
MGRNKNSSMPGKGLWVALFAIPVVVVPVRGGIVAVNGSGQQTPDTAEQTKKSREYQSGSSEMYLPDPAHVNAIAAGDSAIPEITIPQLPADVSATTAASKDNANAIPLPPAVQTGLTGLAALGLAGGLRRLRRAFR